MGKIKPGQRFGNLTVIKLIEENSYKRKINGFASAIAEMKQSQPKEVYWMDLKKVAGVSGEKTTMLILLAKNLECSPF